MMLGDNNCCLFLELMQEEWKAVYLHYKISFEC